MSRKLIQSKYPNSVVKRSFFGEYTFKVENEGDVYHILILNVHRNSILTINSKYVWQIKYGRRDNVNFKTLNSKLIDMKSFMKLENRIVVFRNQPFKILKHLNEADIIDISTAEEIFGCDVFDNINKITLKKA